MAHQTLHAAPLRHRPAHARPAPVQADPVQADPVQAARVNAAPACGPLVARLRRTRGLVGLAMMALAAQLAPAQADRAAATQVCDMAAAQAARATGVPLDVLRAIARIESGRAQGGRVTPWPWTVNMEGSGRWFESARETLTYLESHRARGARSFDVGCFQINYRWHGEAFASLSDMLEPRRNALYAAQFLASLRTELGDWTRAVGAYHSRTPTHARRYLAQFEKAHAALAPPGTSPNAAPGIAAPHAQGAARRPIAPADRPQATQAAPLFVSNRSAAPGSLVALPPAGPALLPPVR